MRPSTAPKPGRESTPEATEQGHQRLKVSLLISSLLLACFTSNGCRASSTRPHRNAGTSPSGQANTPASTTSTGYFYIDEINRLGAQAFLDEYGVEGYHRFMKEHEEYCDEH